MRRGVTVKVTAITVLKDGHSIAVFAPDNRFLATIILQMDGDMLKVLVEHEGSVEVEERIPTL